MHVGFPATFHFRPLTTTNNEGLHCLVVIGAAFAPECSVRMANLTAALWSTLIRAIFLTFALGSEVWMLPCALQCMYFPWLRGVGGGSGRS